MLPYTLTLSSQARCDLLCARSGSSAHSLVASELSEPIDCPMPREEGFWNSNRNGTAAPWRPRHWPRPRANTTKSSDERPSRARAARGSAVELCPTNKPRRSLDSLHCSFLPQLGTAPGVDRKEGKNQTATTSPRTAPTRARAAGVPPRRGSRKRCHVRHVRLSAVANIRSIYFLHVPRNDDLPDSGQLRARVSRRSIFSINKTNHFPSRLARDGPRLVDSDSIQLPFRFFPTCPRSTPLNLRV